MVDWDWQIVNKGFSSQQIGLARDAGQSGWSKIGPKIFLLFLLEIFLMNSTNISFVWKYFCSVWKYFWSAAIWIGKGCGSGWVEQDRTKDISCFCSRIISHEFDKYFFGLKIFLLSPKIFLVHRYLDWQGKLSGGWSIWATAKSSWKYQERPPNIFGCHEIWWTSNPPFSWEKFGAQKFYIKISFIRSWRDSSTNQTNEYGRIKIRPIVAEFDLTQNLRESLQINSVNCKNFHVAKILREDAENHALEYEESWTPKCTMENSYCWKYISNLYLLNRNILCSINVGKLPCGVFMEGCRWWHGDWGGGGGYCWVFYLSVLCFLRVMFGCLGVGLGVC